MVGSCAPCAPWEEKGYGVTSLLCSSRANFGTNAMVEHSHDAKHHFFYRIKLEVKSWAFQGTKHLGRLLSRG